MRILIATSTAMLLTLPVASQALPDGTQFSNGPVVTAASGSSQTPSAAACSSYNMLAKTTMAGGNTNVFATGSWVASPAQVVFGASVRTKAKTASGGKVTCQIAIVDTAGMPTTVNAATCVINVSGTNFATYSGKFAKPIVLKPGTRYALVHSGDGQVDHPRNADANAVRVAHYWHPPSSTTWSGPWSSVSWAVQVDCLGGPGRVPEISNTGEPKINTSFAVNLAKAAAHAPCALIIGATRAKIDLTGLGAPGCTLLASTDITLAMKADAAGTAVTTLKVPNNSYYVAKKFAFQWAVIDAKANRLGVALTSGGEATIGK